MCIDPWLVDPGLMSKEPDECGRQSSLQAEDVPAGFLGTYLERPACRRGVEDVAFDDVAATFDGLLENWDELLGRCRGLFSLFLNTYPCVRPSGPPKQTNASASQLDLEPQCDLHTTFLRGVQLLDGCTVVFADFLWQHNVDVAFFVLHLV
jgi:hypothetical protein